MTKIRKAVIPAAGSRRIFPFALKYYSYTAHGAITGGRAVFIDSINSEGLYD